MKTVFLVFTTDNWHSHASKDLIGCATTFNIALKLIKEQVNKDGEELNQDDLYNLNHIKQTQNYAGEGEFIIEEITVNKLN